MTEANPFSLLQREPARLRMTLDAMLSCKETSSPLEFARKVVAELGESSVNVEFVSRALMLTQCLFQVARLRRSPDRGIDAVLDEFVENFLVPSGIPAHEEHSVRAELESNRSEIVASLERLCERSSPLTFYKLQDLSTRTERELRDARVFTSALPVYVGDGSEVAAFLLSAELTVEYASRSSGEEGNLERRTFSVAPRDLDRLVAELQRASHKLKALEKSLEGLPSIAIYGGLS